MPLSFSRRLRRRRSVDVSVVIPLYNHARYVESAIRSVFRQSVDVREVICIDDGSRDDSFAVAERLALEFPTLRTWTRPNRGANRTINEAISAARGEYVAILNSDDVFESERLERCLEPMLRASRTGLVCSGVEFIDDDGRPIENEWYRESLREFKRSGDLASSLVRGNFVMTTSNFVARRSLFEEVGEFDDLRYTHDLDFLLRVVAAGRHVVVLPEPLLRYRYHATNTISESHAAVRVEVAAVVAGHVRRILRRAGEGSLDAVRRLLAATDAQGLTAGVVHFLGRADVVAATGVMASSFLSDPEYARLRQELSP